MHLLLIEDDLELGGALHATLRAEGYTVQWLRRAQDAPLQLDDGVLSAVLLDLGLPDGDGLRLLARWRAREQRTPVLVITARSALQERLRGLDGGADDYLVKPFATPELLSRLRAVLRRSVLAAAGPWAVGPLSIDPARFEARLDGRLLDLSPREFRLLQALAQDAGAVVPKGLLAQRVEPLGDAVGFGALEVHVCNLRRKIGPQHICTVRGVGYMLTC